MILHGEAIEDYPEAKPFPSALFLGWSGNKPLHAVAAYDSLDDQVYIITVYEPDLQHFEPDFRARRKR